MAGTSLTTSGCTTMVDNRFVSDKDIARIQFDLPLLRQSERAAFKRCNWSWYQQYVNNWKPIVETNKTAAEFGTLIHVALAEYYKPGGLAQRGPHPAETFERLAKDVVAAVRTTNYTNDENVSKWEDFLVLGTFLMDEYIIHYGGDPHWEVLDAERRFDVVIPDVRYKPLESEKGRRGYRPMVTLVGTFDLCYRDLNDDKVKMVDHKTAAQLTTDHLTLDEQASTYIAVATTALRHQGLIGAKESVVGMEYNFIHKVKPFKEPLKQHYIDALEAEGFHDVEQADGRVVPIGKLLKDSLKDICEAQEIEVRGDRTDAQLFMRHYVGRTFKERQRQIVRISEEARVMDLVRTGQLPLLKTPQRDCNWCQYFDMCELDESGDQEAVDYFVETTMKKADPYFDHRDDAKNSKKITDA
jgi:hypothetical protein